MASRKPETQQETKVDLDALVQRVNQLEDEVATLKSQSTAFAHAIESNGKSITALEANTGSTSGEMPLVSADIDFRELRGRVSKLERRLG